MKEAVLRKKVQEKIAQNSKLCREISDYVFKHPELGGEEFQSSQYLKHVLAQKRFTVTSPYESLPTAFAAEYGNDGFTTAFLAEYDALPGYGPKRENAHACGHNWIAATMTGAAIVLSELSNELPCRVKLIGTPAEETFGAKYDLCRYGAFDDVDVVFQAHLEAANSIEPATLAMNSVEFCFKGKAAHAAQHPEDGINALDSVILMFNGINALRQQTRQDARIHGIITEGGEAANIIPDRAVCKFSFRARDVRYLRELREKMIDIAKASAAMTGASLSYRDYENPFDDLCCVPALTAVCRQAFEETGITNFIPPQEYNTPGSSDIGNVSHVCPTQYVELTLDHDQPVLVHDESALQLVNSEAAYRKMDQTIEAFVMSVWKICQNQDLQAEIKQEFHDLTKE